MAIHKLVFHTSEIQNMKGDNEEEWVAFFLWNENPLSSAWKWFHTEQEAKDFNPTFTEKE